MTNPNDPAFSMAAGPLLTEDGITRPIHPEEYGLTKREWFAGLAMQGLLANLYASVQGSRLLNKLENKPEENTCQVISRNAVLFADALIAELSKEK